MLFSLQATELAELTSKISLLEDAKKKKEDEAIEWQQKVWSPFLLLFNSRSILFLIWLRIGITFKVVSE